MIYQCQIFNLVDLLVFVSVTNCDIKVAVKR